MVSCAYQCMSAPQAQPSFAILSIHGISTLNIQILTHIDLNLQFALFCLATGNPFNLYVHGNLLYTNYPKEMSGHFLDKVGLIMQKPHIAGTNHW